MCKKNKNVQCFCACKIAIVAIKTDLTHVRVFILNNSFSKFPYHLLTLCVTITTNLTNGLFINYTRIDSAFNKLSENIYFYILTLTIMAVVFDLLRAIAEYWFRIKNGISWGTFWFQIEEYERVKFLWNNASLWCRSISLITKIGKWIKIIHCQCNRIIADGRQHPITIFFGGRGFCPKKWYHNLDNWCTKLY